MSLQEGGDRTVKIGIISEIKENTINYGNILQSFALNRYLRDTFPGDIVETLFFEGKEKTKVTSYLALLRRVIEKIWWKIRNKKPSVALDVSLVENRIVASRRFQMENINLCPQKLTWKQLLESDYDLFIVGSDVVWSQSKAHINRIKFLDFNNKAMAEKVSYAASFGENFIPRANQMAIRKALQRFKSISVRENSSIELLHSIGVENVVQTADPTLLLSADQWAFLERAPKEMTLGKPYCFTYFLGANDEQKRMVKQACNDLPITYIPYAAGNKQTDVVPFGDILVPDCSPEEWLWLVHHAEYVFTDSFHGLVFSTIFKKKFLAIKRNYIRDINIRMEDFLSMIGQDDKILHSDKAADLRIMRWDYEEIDNRLDRLKAFSKAFLAEACN